MSHIRQQIRASVATRLATVGTVSVSRAYPIQDLPILLVYTPAEELQADVSEFDLVDRRLVLVVEAVASGEAVDDQLDALLVGVEQALNGSTLDGLAVVVLPQALEVTFSAEGSAPIGRAKLTYGVHYRTPISDPETSL